MHKKIRRTNYSKNVYAKDHGSRSHLIITLMCYLDGLVCMLLYGAFAILVLPNAYKSAALFTMFSFVLFVYSVFVYVWPVGVC